MNGLIVTYLIVYGGAVAAVINPFCGVLAYVILSIIKPELLWHWAVPAGNYSRTVAIAMLIGWAIRGFGSWKLGRGAPMVVLLLMYWAWCAIGASIATNQELAWAFVDYLSKIVLPFLVGVTVIDSVKKLEWLAWTIALSLGYVALDFNQSYLSGFNRLYWVGFFGGDGNCAALGLVSAVWVVFFIGLESRSRLIKVVALLSTLLIVHAIFFSFSRGGMLGLILSALVAFCIMPKTPKHWIAALLAVLLGLQMAGPDVREELLNIFVDKEERDESAEGRVTQWKRCIELIREEPIFGVGPDHFPLVNKERWGEGFEAHSLWLQLGTELGLTGLSLLIAFYATCWFRLLPYASGSRPAQDPRLRQLAQGVVASLVGFAVAAQFVSLEQLEIPYYLVMMGVVLLKLECNDLREVPLPDEAVPPGIPEPTSDRDASPEDN